MTLKKARKMYLISPQQIDRLTQPTSSIRETAEEDLNNRMRAVLNDPGLNSYEKIKKYNALLQRYLNFAKQDQNDLRRVTLTLQRDPTGEHGDESNPLTPGGNAAASSHDETSEDILKNLLPRDRKNAEFIIKKLSNSAWNSKGEFIYNDAVVNGSNMIDLFKHLSFPYKKFHTSPPTGWSVFLNRLSELNIPISSLSNPKARDQYRRLKTGMSENTEEILQQDTSQTPRKTGGKRKKKLISPPWITGKEGKEEEGDAGTVAGQETPIKRKKRQFTLSPRWFSS